MKKLKILFTVSFQFSTGEQIFSVMTSGRNEAYNAALNQIRKQNLEDPIKLNSIKTICDLRDA